MARLTVEFDGVARTLGPDEVLIFGRDPSCRLVIGPGDPTISRHTAQVRWQNGTWWVVNLSQKRALEVREPTGLTSGLPVSTPDRPPSSRAIDQAELTVVVVGRDRDYEVVLRPEQAVIEVAPATRVDPLTTVAQRSELSDKRREVLVAMARGYLRTGAHHDPNPLTYKQIAEILGLTPATVMRRIQTFRESLIDGGVPGLAVADARRPLCEWLLRMRWIGPDDLAWLQPRIDTAQAERTRGRGSGG